jgi:hypothetical protein
MHKTISFPSEFEGNKGGIQERRAGRSSQDVLNVDEVETFSVRVTGSQRGLV